MLISPMSHVVFKKWPCRPVDFRGLGPYVRFMEKALVYSSMWLQHECFHVLFAFGKYYFRDVPVKIVDGWFQHFSKSCRPTDPSKFRRRREEMFNMHR